MNIFSALSQGKGQLNEENMSAMLGFLLAPYQTHDVGDVFLRYFLDAVALSCGDIDRFKAFTDDTRPIKAEVFFEETYAIEHRTRAVDIEIRLYEQYLDDPKEIHRIAVENKIKAQSADETQFADEYEGLLQDIGDDPVQITMVFLTPAGEHPKLFAEYASLTVAQSHRKAWLHWHQDESDVPTITYLLRELLANEAQAQINPISEYIRHTIKAFAYHIASTVTPTDQKLPKPPHEVGELIAQAEVNIKAGHFRIERYRSGTIRIFDIEAEKNVSAWQVIKDIIAEKQLPIELKFSSGSEKNTRTLGKELLDAL